ncbi:TetR family transcriptional regulator [Streptomyces sp. MNU77]|uniref:acyl-CoA-like ligand-binding transcription factor n=1 Tax=Streptomyces sp. MNU77 TaxID=1573406 RepID=UPI0005E86210|nr:TetR family transcriptional regulator [Streptomyces sp. MNU77]OLO25831.1 TetR family transcriptional regulator [Streptomyces sp. MNU77]
MTHATGLAQRKRQFVRDELTRETLRLLAVQGYEATTVEQVTDAVGVSRRTFFRYFQSKEDVIVQVVTAKGTELATALEARPRDETAAVALRHTLHDLAAQVSVDTERQLHLLQLILRTPALHARFLERQARWKDVLTSTLAEREGMDAADLRPALMVGVALTALQTALNRWAESEATENLTDLLDRTFTLVEPVLRTTP